MLETNYCEWLILCVVIFLSVLLKIELCFVYDYLLTGCVNISVNCTVVVVETKYLKKRIEKEKETMSWCNKK